MPMKRSKKAEEIERLRLLCQRADMAVLGVNVGLTVAEFTDLRSQMRGKCLLFKVVKNTFLRIAAAGTGVEAVQPSLKGSTILILAAKDPVTPSKTLRDYAKKNPKFKIKAAELDGKALSVQALSALADLPSREELLSTLMGTIQAPIADMASLMKNVAGTFVRTTEAYREKLEKSASA